MLKRAMLPCATVLLHCRRCENFKASLQQARYQMFLQASREALLRPPGLVYALKARGRAGMTAVDSAKICCSTSNQCDPQA